MCDSYTTTPRLLYVAMQLFLKQGFAATSLDQICRTTGVSKGALFHYYHSKDEVAEAAIDYFWELLDEHLFGGLEFFEPKARLERVHERMMALPEHLHFEHGSLFAVLSNEVTEEQRGMRERLAHGYEAWITCLAALISATGKPEALSKQLAQQWIAIYEGSIAQAKASGDNTVIREQLQLFAKLTQLI